MIRLWREALMAAACGFGLLFCVWLALITRPPRKLIEVPDTAAGLDAIAHHLEAQVAVSNRITAAARAVREAEIAMAAASTPTERRRARAAWGRATVALRAVVTAP